MSKHTQKNWLLIITGLLLISSGFILYFSMKEQFGFGLCAYNGITYRSGDIISDSGESCFCNKYGRLECLSEDDSKDNGFSDFISTDLNFYYKFINLLDKSNADSTNVDIKDIVMKDSKLIVILEREALCTNDNVAPVTVGFYNYAKDSLTLTTMTNKDTIYTKPCLVENTYEITSLKSELSDNFNIYYKTESLDLLNLHICIEGQRAFVDGDVFKSNDGKMICTCDDSQVVCNDAL